MVRAWYHDGSDVKPSEPHMLEPDVFISPDELLKLTGVETFAFDAETLDDNPAYSKLKEERGYKCEDRVEVSRKSFPNYDEKMSMFYTEHLHTDEEIRYFEAGCGYFDVRTSEDKWVRIEATKNDILIVPANLYHRFIPDVNEFVKARRLFTESPSWIPVYRNNEA